jgi:hypothetical protein
MARHQGGGVHTQETVALSTFPTRWDFRDGSRGREHRCGERGALPPDCSRQDSVGRCLASGPDIYGDNLLDRPDRSG